MKKSIGKKVAGITAAASLLGAGYVAGEAPFGASSSDQNTQRIADSMSPSLVDVGEDSVEKSAANHQVVRVALGVKAIIDTEDGLNGNRAVIINPIVETFRPDINDKTSSDTVTMFGGRSEGSDRSAGHFVDGYIEGIDGTESITILTADGEQMTSSEYLAQNNRSELLGLGGTVNEPNPVGSEYQYNHSIAIDPTIEMYNVGNPTEVIEELADGGIGLLYFDDQK